MIEPNETGPAETVSPPAADLQRQRIIAQRNRVMALLLGAFVVLFFVITIVKIRA